MVLILLELESWSLRITLEDWQIWSLIFSIITKMVLVYKRTLCIISNQSKLNQTTQSNPTLLLPKPNYQAQNPKTFY